MKSQFLLLGLPIAFSLTFFAAGFADERNTEQRVAIKSLDEIPWMVGTSEGNQTLDEDIEGIGKKGDPVTIRVTTKKIQDGKFFMATGSLVQGDQKHEMFREIWGMQPSSSGLHKWVFDRSGMVLEGKLYMEGEDKIVHVIEGKVIPTDEPFKSMAKKLNLKELPYYGEMVFRRIDGKTLGVTVQAVKIGNLPFPWPNLDNEEIFRAME